MAGQAVSGALRRAYKSVSPKTESAELKTLI